VVLIEVLSDDTAETDRNRKRDDYAHLPGLRRYLLIEQTTAAAKVLQRTVAGWTESDVTSGHIALPEVGADIPLAAIYVGVDLV
jgi:Uma2 family endonuclease